MKPTYLLILFLLLLITSILAFLRFQPAAQKYTQITGVKELTPKELRIAVDYYKKITDEKNPVASLETLRQNIKKDNSLARSCHEIAHEIGHEAFKKYKDLGKALSFMDETCNGGYIHGVLESYLTQSGNNLVSDIGSICKNYPSGSLISWECYHGVGHGLMFYTNGDIYRSVDFCNLYTDDFARNACINGAYMQNFNPDEKIHPSKYLSSKDNFYPCDLNNLPDLSDCYLYSPVYYLTTHGDNYLDALNWCQSADKNYVQFCIEGVGSQAIKENLNDKKLVENVCAQAGIYKQDCLQGMNTELNLFSQ